MNATLSVGISSNQATDDGTSDDDYDLYQADDSAISAGSSHTFTLGRVMTSFKVDLRDDDIYEGGSTGTKETIKFDIGSLVNASAGTHTSLLYSITDVTDKPVQFSNDGNKN